MHAWCRAAVEQLREEERQEERLRDVDGARQEQRQEHAQRERAQREAKPAAGRTRARMGTCGVRACAPERESARGRAREGERAGFTPSAGRRRRALHRTALAHAHARGWGAGMRD